MRFETLEVTKNGPIAHVALNRPKALNAMNHQFFQEIGDAFRALDRDTDIRAIVLSGNGKHFTAGLDLKENASVMAAPEGEAARERERLRRHIKWLQDSFTAIEKVNAPVIAVTHGACVGGGIDLISACDIRVASADTWFCIQEINVGIIADLGTLQRMGSLVPQGILRELALTGRKFASDEAKDIGFLNHVKPSKEDALSEAFEIAQTIASKSPVAITGIKHVLNHARDNSVADGLDYIATWNSGVLIGDDLIKAATAMLQKEEPEFENLLASND